MVFGGGDGQEREGTVVVAVAATRECKWRCLGRHKWSGEEMRRRDEEMRKK